MKIIRTKYVQFVQILIIIVTNANSIVLQINEYVWNVINKVSLKSSHDQIIVVYQNAINVFFLINSFDIN